MIRSDNHVHTAFSTDSRESMYHMVQQAVTLGFSSICFTDHMDYDFPPEQMKVETDMPFLFDMDEYLAEIQNMREQFPSLEIRQGVELGLKPSVLRACQNLTASYPLDFVIGSTHLVDDIDPYYPEYWESREESTGIRLYYESTLDNVTQSFDYDVYGHLDYILRYTPSMRQLQQENKNTDAYLASQCKMHADIMDEILHRIIENGKGIEVNTAGLKYGMGHPHPHEWILARYRELGGEIITTGSDAHEQKHLGYRFEILPSLLAKCGFRYCTEFRQRAPEMYPIR